MKIIKNLSSGYNQRNCYFDFTEYTFYIRISNVGVVGYDETANMVKKFVV